MNSADYLDKAMKLRDIRNDSQLAQALNWSRAKVSNYRHLKQAMDNDACREIAGFLDISVIEVIANMEVQRAKDSGHRKAWKKLAKLSSQAAYTTYNTLFSISLFCLSSGILYIMLNRNFNSKGPLPA